MPSGSIATGSPYTLTVNGTCPPLSTIAGMPAGAVDPPSIGLFVSVKVVPVSTGNSYSAYTRKCTYGPSDTLMESVGVIDCGGSPVNGWIEVFFLKGVTPGASTSSKVVYTNRNLADSTNAPVKSIIIDTITYSRVDQITPNSVTTTAFTGASASMYAQSSVSKQVVGFFACSGSITGASSGTSRLGTDLGSGVGNAGNGSIVDAPGASVVGVTATSGSSANWGGIVLSIDHIVAPNTDHYTTSYNQIGDSKSILVAQSPPPTSPLTSVDFDLSAYADSATIPSDFTVTSYGVGASGTLGISDGLAKIVNLATDATTRFVSQAILNTDMQGECVDVSFIPTGEFGTVTLLARNSGATATSTSGQGDGVRAEFYFVDPALIAAGLSPSTVVLYITNSAGVQAFASGWYFTAVKGARYKLRCGMIGSDGVEYPHRYQLLINDVPQPIISSTALYYEDIFSRSDLTKKKIGFTAAVGVYQLSNPAVRDGGVDMPLRYFGGQDQDSNVVYVDQNISSTKPQGKLSLPAGQECVSLDRVEIDSKYRLEIPSTSSLEVYAAPRALGVGAGGPAAAYVDTSEATASTTYTDLATTTDTVTINVGPSGAVMVFLNALFSNNSIVSASLVSFAMSGANTQSATDTFSVGMNSTASAEVSGITAGIESNVMGTAFLVTGLTAGSTVFKMKYRASGGATATFQYRRIAAIPL